MRTKTLLCAAALAAGVATSMAQSNVYSLNVVGYVNVPLTGGANFTMIANPLNNTNNGIANLFSTASDGDQVYRWDPTGGGGGGDFQGTIYTYSTGQVSPFIPASWDANFILKPGEGVFYLNAGPTRTNTFVGEVIQGSYSNYIVGGALFNSIGSSAPIGNSHTNSTGGLTYHDGDQVYTWNASANLLAGGQDLNPAIATYSTGQVSPFIPAHWDDTTIAVAPGIGFFYLGAGPNTPWIRNFTVQ